MKINERIVINQPSDIRVIEKTVTEENKESRIILEGRLITADSPTRNGVAYTLSSLARFVKIFNENKMTIPFLDSHDDSSIREKPPFGHVFELFIKDNDIMYRADIDPSEEMFLRKVRRGDIKEVSLQAIVNQIDEQEALGDNEEYIIANVAELLEVSGVLIPGARNTTMQLLEKMGIISERTFVERLGKFRKSGMKSYEKFKESLKKEELQGGNVNEPEDEEEDITGLPNQEEINLGNSDAIVGTELPKKIRKNEEKFIFIMDNDTTKEKADVKCICGGSMIKESKDNSYSLRCIKCKKEIRRK